MQNNRVFISLSVLILFVFSFSFAQKNENIVYPKAKKNDHVDNYFGVKVPDPYRWMEDDKAEEVKKWVDEENKITFDYLKNITFRDNIRKRLEEVYNYPKYSAPRKAGDYYFFTKNDGLQNQSVYFIQKGLDGTPEVFLDQNKLSSDGTVTYNFSGTSRDNKYATFTKGEAGSDWQEIRVFDIETKKEISDAIRWVKSSGTQWFKDGFYYSAYDKPEKGKELTAKNEYHKVYYHKLGTDQAQDKLIFSDKDHALRYHGVQVTDDEKYLLLHISEGTSGNEIYYKSLSDEAMDFKPLFKGFGNNSGVIDNIGDKFIAITDMDAPNKKIVLIDPKNVDKNNWKVIIPEKNEVIQFANIVGGKLIVGYLKDVTTKVYQYLPDGKFEKEIDMPSLGTASGFGGRNEDKITFYSFNSFTFPNTIYKYDIASGKSELFRQSEVKFNPNDYETKQIFYTSKDKTKVPMFLVYKKGLKLDGNNPTLLYAYGGFNINMLPSFNATRIVLLEKGFIYAMPNLRGGGEYGEKWHKAGMLQNKQNVFDDFISAAEYLINEKYTSKTKLAISGGSNGGLLVGACMTQRPDLYKVALPAVGVMDMLRFHKFTVGWGWVVEYGSSDDEKNFKNLFSYSPLHNIKSSVFYPATLVTTADHDDRVVPAHSFKFMATLQEKHKGDNSVLIRIETRAGHGGGKPTSKALDETADVYSFMFYNLGVKF